MGQLITRSAVCMLFLLFSVASISATRQDVYRALGQINSNWPESSIEVLINGQGSGATVVVGEGIRYFLKSGQPGYFAMVHVDSHGTVTVIRPGAGKSLSKQLTFPQANAFVAEPPLGKETLFVVMSEQPIADEALGLSAGEEIVQRSNSVQLAEQFAAAVADSIRHTRVAVAKIEYYVEGAAGTTQYTTRGIVREFSDEEVASGSVVAEPEPMLIAMATPQSDEQAARDSVSKSAKKLKNKKVGKSVALQMVRFEFGSATLTTQGMLNLDVFGEAFLSGTLENQKYVLAGHTDDLGPDSYNQDLSLRRALSAQRYLVEMFGIAADRLEPMGYGASRPVQPNVDADSRAKNRRVVFDRVP